MHTRLSRSWVQAFRDAASVLEHIAKRPEPSAEEALT